MAGAWPRAGVALFRGLSLNGTFTLPGSSAVGGRASLEPSLCVLLLVFVGVCSLGVAMFGLRVFRCARAGWCVGSGCCVGWIISSGG